MAKHGKIAVAVSGGLLVGTIIAAVHLATLPHERGVILHSLIGDFIAVLATIIVCLAIQLKHEEIHYNTTIERAAIVAELNHHIRNAVFPLCLAVQKLGDAGSIQAAQDAMERINIALKDATVDALSGRAQYRPEESAGRLPA
jgi:uncharacterized membrane protein